MRILFINTGPWGTGSFTIIKGLAKALLKQGHDVKIFFPDSKHASKDNDEYYRHPSLYNIWTFPIKNKHTVIPTFPLMISDPHPRNPDAIYFKNLTDAQMELYLTTLRLKLTQVIKEFKPNIIESHHIWYASWVLNQLGHDYIAVAHHSDQLGFRFDTRVREKAIIAAEGATFILTASEAIKREILKLYHVNENKIIVASNGYDDEVFTKHAVNREKLLEHLGLHIDKDAPIINFAGKLSRTKGVDVIFQANKLLDPKMNIQTIVMGCGNLDAILKKLDPASYDLKNIHFVGHVTPEIVADIHNISKLSIMPSRSEGFGLACLEAMGCGLPMVVSKCPGPQKYAVGRLVDIGSAEQLADAIMAILKLPPDAYHHLCHEAQVAAKKIAWHQLIENHLKIYQLFLKKKKTKTKA